MQKLFLTNYADENYGQQQLDLLFGASNTGQFDKILEFTDKDLKQSRFYAQNRILLDEQKRGDDGRIKPGYFAWKPWVILEALNNDAVSINDVVVYMDCGDAFNKDVSTMRDKILRKTKVVDMILTAGAFKNSAYCKMDAFVYTNCTDKRYASAIQIEAGIIVVKKTAFTLLMLSHWLKYCKDRRIISDDENVCGIDNYPDFIHHRWDQSVLTLLSNKHDIYQSDLMREFVTCNKNDR